MEIDSDKFLLYNTYTNNLFEINKQDYGKLLNIKAGNFTDIEDGLIKELIHNNILVEDDRILTQKIKLARLNTRFCSDVMHLTIAPTIACNFSCPYCYENNISIKKSMNIKVQSENIKSI